MWLSDHWPTEDPKWEWKHRPFTLLPVDSELEKWTFGYRLNFTAANRVTARVSVDPNVSKKLDVHWNFLHVISWVCLLYL